MLHRVFSLLVVALTCLAVVSSGLNAQDKKGSKGSKVTKESKAPTSPLQETVGKLISPDKTWDPGYKKAADVVLEELLKDPKGSITGIVDIVSARFTDYKARMALHMLLVHLGGDAKLRPEAAKTLAATLNGDRPKEVQGFIVREMQWVGGEKQTPVIGKLLLDTDVGENAAQCLLAIKSGAAEQFRAALPKATAGKQRTTIVHGLGTLKDKESTGALAKYLTDENRDTRLNAAWALANIADAKSAKSLLKLADGAKGYERDNATISCFLLAENLAAAGDKVGARNIYAHINETRTDDGERFVKDAAVKGLANLDGTKGAKEEKTPAPKR